MPDIDPTCRRLLSSYLEALREGERERACRMIVDAAESGVPVADLYRQVLQESQYAVGGLWESGELSVAEEHFCTAVTQLVMSQLYPRLLGAPETGRTLVATAVAGDLHEVGVRMVADFFTMAGWRTFYLGADTPPESVARSVVERGADLLAISTTLAVHLPRVAEMIETVRAWPGTDGVRILVGGRPFLDDPSRVDAVGADGWATDAAAAVERARELLEAPPPSGSTHPRARRVTAEEPAPLDAGDRILDEMSRLNNALANTQRDLTVRNAELERTSCEKNELLGTVAHDLRNPLAVIDASARLLLANVIGPLAEPQRALLENLASSSRFMSALVGDLLDFSAIESGQVTLRPEAFDLAGLVREMARLQSMLASEKKITVRVEGPETLRMRGDAHKLLQVLTNLVTNAVKFSPRDSEVEIRVGDEATHALVEVRDQGPGIPVDEQAALFEPFSRTSVRPSGGEKSTGLGLAIAKRIVDAHGGRLELESRPGAGSTFRLHLPRDVSSGS